MASEKESGKRVENHWKSSMAPNIPGKERAMLVFPVMIFSSLFPQPLKIPSD